MPVSVEALDHVGWLLTRGWGIVLTCPSDEQRHIDNSRAETLQGEPR